MATVLSKQFVIAGMCIVMYIEIRMREGVAECDLIRTLQPRVSKEIIHRNKLGACPGAKLPKTLNS